MSNATTTESARVVDVAAGMDGTNRPAPAREVIRWTGDQTRCTVTITDGGITQVAHHESSADGAGWTPSMDVTLRKVAWNEKEQS